MPEQHTLLHAPRHGADRPHPRPPPRAALLLEARAPFEAATSVARLASTALFPRAARRSHAIMVVPGFGVGDEASRLLRYYLKRQGHQTRGWGLGKNLAGIDIPHGLSDLSDRWDFEHREEYRGEASVALLSDRLADAVLAWKEGTGEPITLIGWSLGGVLAREVARDYPEAVRHVVTLGTPVRGGPKYSAVAEFFRKRKMDLDWIEREIDKRGAIPMPVSVTAIYSRSDGIVSWTATVDERDPTVEHVRVDSSHLGMMLNPRVWRAVDRALSRA